MFDNTRALLILVGILKAFNTTTAVPAEMLTFDFIIFIIQGNTKEFTISD